MNLSNLSPSPEQKKNRKRIGRGPASGQGTTSGKGNKGQNSRSGGGVRPGFEGGQMPLARRLPKRGFKNPFRVAYDAVNIDRLLEAFEGVDEITLEAMYERGLCRKNAPVKVLGRGDCTRAISVEAHKFSTSAKEKIEKAGGSVKALEG